MSFPTTFSVGTQYTTPAGQTYEYTTAGGWQLVRDTNFAIPNFTLSTSIDSGSDHIVWYDTSAGVHRKMSFDDLANLLGTTATPSSGVVLI